MKVFFAYAWLIAVFFRHVYLIVFRWSNKRLQFRNLCQELKEDAFYFNPSKVVHEYEYHGGRFPR